MRIVYFIILFSFVCNCAKNQGLTNSLNEIADMNNVLGAKNLLPNNAVSWTYGGITFTVNSDGSVTANGTASETVWLLVSDNIKLDNIAYTLTGCPEGGGGGIYEIHIRSTESDSSQWQFFIDYGNGITFTGDPNRNYTCYIAVAIGKTVSNLVFKPMLRLASIQDDTYVPYSMTNRELSNNISNVYTKTEVNALTHGYILQGMHRVRVSSNATTTTFGNLINSLYNDTASYLNTLTDNDYYQIASVRVPGSDIKFVTPEITTHDKLFELEQNIYMMIKIGNTVFMYYIEVRGGNASRMFTPNNDGTLTEITNNIIGQERSIEYNINLYHHN